MSLSISVADVVAAVPDPELPIVTIADLGILRGVDEVGGTTVVTITPTYSGCPAMDAIRDDVRAACASVGVTDVEVRTVFAPAWTTDWITAGGAAKLEEAGIAPPQPIGDGPVPVALAPHCPQCGSGRTHEVSRFGSTSCKSLWACDACLEPFDHFKAL